MDTERIGVTKTSQITWTIIILSDQDTFIIGSRTSDSHCRIVQNMFQGCLGLGGNGSSLPAVMAGIIKRSIG